MHSCLQHLSHLPGPRHPSRLRWDLLLIFCVHRDVLVWVVPRLLSRSLLLLPCTSWKAEQVWCVVTDSVVLVAPILLLVHCHPSAETTLPLSHVFIIPVLSSHLHPFPDPLRWLGPRGPPQDSSAGCPGNAPCLPRHLPKCASKQGAQTLSLLSLKPSK